MGVMIHTMLPSTFKVVRTKRGMKEVVKK